MYYLMIIIAVVMFSFQFALNEGFGKEEGNDFNSSFRFVLYTSVSGFFVLLITNKFHLEFSLFSLLTATAYCFVCIASSYVSIKAFTYANLSVYSVFSMIGGMILPFLYGILTGEEFKIIRLVCCILICFSVTMSINKGEHSKKALIYYLFVFVLNGLGGVILKFHQSYPEICVDSGSFMILTRIVAAVMSIILILLQKDRKISLKGKSLIYCTIYSALNGIGNLLLLIALLHLPASVQYPIVTGGVIITSTIITILKREPISAKEIMTALIAFVATIFMAI